MISTNTINMIFIAPTHLNNSPRVDLDMSLYSDTLSWFQTNQSSLLLVNDTYVVQKKTMPFFLYVVETGTLIIKPQMRLCYAFVLLDVNSV
jgi:hypothetical protein